MLPVSTLNTPGLTIIMSKVRVASLRNNIISSCLEIEARRSHIEQVTLAQTIQQTDRSEGISFKTMDHTSHPLGPGGITGTCSQRVYSTAPR